jgi:N2-acetyl-L-2,4-diaminobutanoate deacetylase
VAKGGAGPTLLVTGGNHGDEYEGPLAILDTARRLDDMKLHGRVILLPFLNYPAVKAAKRTSPVDGRNMNRIFPGSPTGSLSEKIADYVMRGLIPMADAVLDFHSGGRTLDFLPFAASHVLPDKTQEARCDAAVAAFAAPYSVKMLEIDAVGMFDTAVEEAGKTFVTTELGGGGTATARASASPGAASPISCTTWASSKASPSPSPPASSTCRPGTASPSPTPTACSS